MASELHVKVRRPNMNCSKDLESWPLKERKKGNI